MRRWHSHYRRAPVIEKTTGERLGLVQRFLVDSSTRAVVALLLREPQGDRPAF